MITVVVKIHALKIETVSFEEASVIETLRNLDIEYFDDDDIKVLESNKSELFICNSDRAGFLVLNNKESFEVFDAEDYPSLVAFLKQGKNLLVDDWCRVSKEAGLLDQMYSSNITI